MKPHEKFRKDVEYQIEQVEESCDLVDRAVADRAVGIYSEVHSKALAHTRPARQFAIGAVYAACREVDRPVQLSELIQDCDATQVRRAHRKINSERTQYIKPISAKAFIDRYVEDLDLPPAAAAQAKEIVEETREAVLGRAPSTQAASAIYLMVTSPIYQAEPVPTQKDIGDIAEVSTVAIRDCYQAMEESWSYSNPDCNFMVIDHSNQGVEL